MILFCIQHFNSFHEAKIIYNFIKKKNFNAHVPIDHFHFKHETRVKEKLLD